VLQINLSKSLQALISFIFKIQEGLAHLQSEHWNWCSNHPYIPGVCVLSHCELSYILVISSASDFAMGQSHALESILFYFNAPLFLFFIFPFFLFSYFLATSIPCPRLTQYDGIALKVKGMNLFLCVLRMGNFGIYIVVDHINLFYLILEPG
jgi:hypothetical protein